MAKWSTKKPKGKLFPATRWRVTSQCSKCSGKAPGCSGCRNGSGHCSCGGGCTCKFVKEYRQ